MTMASKFTCVCGNQVRANLYEGHGLRLLVEEECTDLSPHELSQPCEEFVDKLVREAEVVAKCQSCGTLALIGNGHEVEFYAPVSR